MKNNNQYLNLSSRDAYGIALFNQAELNKTIVAVTADVPDSVRFSKFREIFQFWDR
jgi:transketolase C-terminal domain/subunit